MKLLPVAERELRVASRRRGTWRVRFGFAAVAIAVSALILLSTLRQSPTQQAQVLFGALSGLAFLYCVFGGLLTTADCISEEKREGTLGLLFLTNLRGYDVVIGKILASSLRGVSGLVAMLPVIGIPLLMGSVGGDQVRNTALVLGNTMFLSLALGVLISVLVRDARHAVGGAMMSMIGLLLLLPLGRWLFIEYVLIDLLHVLDRQAAAREPLEWLLYANPAMLFLWSNVPVAAAATGKFWAALQVQHALAWLALVAACVLVPRSWRDRAERRDRRAAGSVPAPGNRSPADPATSATDAPPTPEPSAAAPVASGDRERSALQDLHPFAWIVTRERRFQWVTWAGLGVIAGVWTWGFLEVREDWLQAVVGLSTLFAAGLWLKFRLASAACRHLHEHRRTGALELVLCTAQTPVSLVGGHLDGLRRALLPPLATILAAGGLLLVAAVGQDRGATDLTDLILTFILGVAVLLLDLWTIAWTGMWLGMRSARYVRAWATTLGQVLVLPWLIFLVGAIAIGVMVELLDLSPAVDPGYRGTLFWWLLIGVGVDVALLTRARRQLLGRFRDLAVEHYGPLAAAPATAGKRS